MDGIARVSAEGTFSRILYLSADWDEDVGAPGFLRLPWGLVYHHSLPVVVRRIGPARHDISQAQLYRRTPCSSVVLWPAFRSRPRPLNRKALDRTGGERWLCSIQT